MEKKTLENLRNVEIIRLKNQNANSILIDRINKV